MSLLTIYKYGSNRSLTRTRQADAYIGVLTFTRAIDYTPHDGQCHVFHTFILFTPHDHFITHISLNARPIPENRYWLYVRILDRLLPVAQMHAIPWFAKFLGRQSLPERFPPGSGVNEIRIVSPILLEGAPTMQLSTPIPLEPMPASVAPLCSA